MAINFNDILDHFTSANLSNFKATHWANVYDFTPNDSIPNFRRYDRDKQDPHKFICPPMPISEYEDLEMSLDEKNSFVPVTRFTEAEDLLLRQRRHEIIFDMQNDDDFKSVMAYYREKFKSCQDPSLSPNKPKARDVGVHRFLGDVEIRGNQVIFIYYEDDEETSN